MASSDILEFLRNPSGFAAKTSDTSQARWSAGLDFARASIDQHGERALRPAQIAAWEAIADLRAALVLGPPGTGKTFALSWMTLGFLEACRQVGQPCRIFLTGFTRNSIANLMEAVHSRAAIHAQEPVRMIWLGRAPEQAFPEDIEVIPPKHIQDAMSTEHVVIGATGWSLYRAITSGKPDGAKGPCAPLFDLICIDEASQMVVSQGLLCLAGLAPSGRVLVAGDNRQLAPVRETHDREVDGLRLGASLYDFLSEAGVRECPLDETFRLNTPLAGFPAQAFYQGRYTPHEDVANRQLPLCQGWEDGLEPWEQLAIDPGNPVCILLYEGPPCGTSNPFEADVVQSLIERFWERTLPNNGQENMAPDFFWSERLAVVTPHRAQNALIRRALRRERYGDGCVVETVDRVQGRERDAIVASYTVSDPEFARVEAGFIFSAERFNVTITRARTKLVLIISRQLLDVLPDDEDAFDQAQVMREYVYESTEVGTLSILGANGQRYPVSMRVRRFDGALPAEMPKIAEAIAPPPDEKELTPEARELLNTVRRLSARNSYSNVASFVLQKELSRTDGEIFTGLRELLALGFLSLMQRRGKRGSFWVAEPKDLPLRPYPADEATVRRCVEQVIRSLRSQGRAPFYERVRDQFRWIGEQGNDAFRPLVEALVAEEQLCWGMTAKRRETLDLTRPDTEPDAERPEMPEMPSDYAFAVLNALEDIEAQRINFGVFESWVTVSDLAQSLDRSPLELEPALRSLRADGWLMRSDERLRSRAAELARELRYVKQRFRNNDADRRPFLVRALKVLFVDRDKPTRDAKLSQPLKHLNEQFEHDPVVGNVLHGVYQMLGERWNVTEPLLASFQARGLLHLLLAWFGCSNERAFVITADTGSGKTEAAGLPIITAAAIDAMRGVQGTRAVLVYPRIRLVNNQAQRLTGYLAALARQKGMPPLTIGLQSGEVPSQFPPPIYLQEYWRPTSRGHYYFPLFACPEGECHGELVLTPAGEDDRADTLDCTQCGWHFEGWMGTKHGIRKTPPSIFLVVTESLHNWLQSQWAGRLFGDADTPAPRAILADEVHLYSHIHGAQVGYALRRLLARARANSTHPDDAPLAIGMSATLGQPARIWSELCGYENVIPIAPNDDERNPNPKSREYFYFVQPEVESRGRDIAGASTTIQSLMCLAHGMRRRRGERGGFRALVFLDSIDKVKRLHGDYLDAENKNLARLRTTDYGPQLPSNIPQTSCCRQPNTCSRFLDGECWYFAATDPFQERAQKWHRPGTPLEVNRTPVFSGAKGRTEELIQTSDIVFSTSSLEVGFDDPDMSLVYQHYAPLNAASFVQRKGRGGRGADDRPVTGVTLSVYSPRDSWFFRRPRRMLDAAMFQVPLNMRNFFVRRGQLIALLLDAAARRLFSCKEPTRDHVTEKVFEDTDHLAKQVFGANYLQELGIHSIDALWTRVRTYVRTPAKYGLGDWAKQIPDVPTRLFDTINLPLVHVSFLNDDREREDREEDITLAFATCAPGTTTRRYGFSVVHWSPPREGWVAWSAVQVEEGSWFETVPGGLPALRKELPSYLHKELGDAVYPQVLRPGRLHLDTVGRFYGAKWQSNIGWAEGARTILSSDTGEEVLELNPKSEGELRGFLVCRAEKELGVPVAVDALRPLTSGAYIYQGASNASHGTGLQVSRIYWGAESRLIVNRNEYRRDEVVLIQTFTHPDDEAASQPERRVLLHGYQVETEGIRLRLDSSQIDRFVDEQVEEIRSTREERWYRGQYFRFLFLSRAPGAGLNRFRSRDAADLLVTARAFPDTLAQLRRLLKRWDHKNFTALLTRTYSEYLVQHPLLSQQRLARLAEDIDGLPRFRTMLEQIVEETRSDEGFRGYLRSVLLHSFAVRVQQAFIIYGAGDPNRVLFHAKLPFQFGKQAEDVIVVCEDGAHGDGTTRTFREHIQDAFEELRSGGLTACPNAREDKILDTLLSDELRLEAWQELDPTKEADVQRLVRDLGLDPQDDSGILQAALRVLFGAEDLGIERFSYLSLQKEVHTIRAELNQTMDREPSAWELVGRVVALAQAGAPQVASWVRLLACYGNLEDASQEESLSAAARLADQVYRLSAKFCMDGCPACLHTGTPLFPSQMNDCTVSRRLLTRLEQWLGWG